MPGYFILLMVGGAALVGIIVMVARAMQRKRTEAFQRQAEQLGFRFEPKTAGIPDSALADFPLFNKGHGRKFRNVLSGGKDEDQVWLFDYRYVTGHGKHRTTHNYTVAAFPHVPKPMPAFQLSPEGLLYRVLTAFGYQDIDFPEHAEFSKRYLLRGRDEDAIRALFHEGVMTHLVHIDGICLEADGPCLLAYKGRRHVSPDHLPAFLDEARGVRDAFVERPRHRLT